MKKLHKNSLEALQYIKTNVGDSKKIVFVSGNFNIVHPGHLRLLRFAEECGDFLVVGVYSDDLEKGAFIKEKQRLEAVQATSWVNYAFILNDQPEDFIAILKPAIVVKGKEYENQYNEELEAVNMYGGRLLFGSGDLSFSSIDLLRNEFVHFNYSTINKSPDFLKHHNLMLSELKSSILSMSRLNVVVLGDMIVDEYISCDPLGMSQEDPTIVVTPVFKERFIGGAGIVAAHAKGLGANVNFFSVIGNKNDDAAKFTLQELSKHGVKIHLYEDESRPTTLKQRFRANGKTLLRVSQLRQHNITMEIQKKIINDLFGVLSDVQLVIFSDFNYGCLPQAMVDAIIDYCRQKQIMMTADSQSSSQIGDVSRFQGMTLLTPTEREARLAVRDFDSGLVILAEKVRKKANAGNVLITLNSEGMLIHATIPGQEEWLTDQLPAMNSAPKDTAGAGDSLLACASMAMAAGCDIWQSAYLGSLAAACQVGRQGNVPISNTELLKEINY